MEKKLRGGTSRENGKEVHAAGTRISLKASATRGRLRAAKGEWREMAIKAGLAGESG